MHIMSHIGVFSGIYNCHCHHQYVRPTAAPMLGGNVSQVYQYVGCVAVVGLHLRDMVDKVQTLHIVDVVVAKVVQAVQE